MIHLQTWMEQRQQQLDTNTTSKSSPKATVPKAEAATAGH